MSELFPAPGGPVKPRTTVCPGFSIFNSSDEPVISFSTSVIARASAFLSPVATDEANDDMSSRDLFIAK